MINLKMYTGSYSLVLIPSLYMEIQNINRVYITMIKKDQFQDVHLVL